MGAGGAGLMAEVELAGVTTGRPRRLRDVSMSIPDGAFVAVVGGSGSGKTSVLRAIAGLDRADSGTVRLGGRDVTAAHPGERDVSMVFQSPALIEHLDVRRNIAFPLKVHRTETDEIGWRVDAEVRALHIEQLMQRAPAGLSHGEQQMVQIARALVRAPAALLLDEPFAALDDHLRSRLRAEIGMLQAGYGVTTVMATKDSADIGALAAMVAVLDAGSLVQWGRVEDVRRSPVNLMAAMTTGTLSLMEMMVVRDQEGFWLTREDPGGGELVRLRSWTPGLARHAGSTVTVALRLVDVEISDIGTVPAVVERAAPSGAGGISCVVAGARIAVATPRGPLPVSGDRLRLRLRHHMLFDRVGGRAID